jgi:hypothetical protein
MPGYGQGDFIDIGKPCLTLPPGIAAIIKLIQTETATAVP